MKKWMYELIIVVALACIGLGTWWFIDTKDARLANAKYEQLVKYAQRQSVEIAIIEQAAKIEKYKLQLTEKQKPKQPVGSITPFVPQSPVVIDPKDMMIK
jgi:predicted negative regulator of RcsB-dependent stress response